MRKWFFVFLLAFLFNMVWETIHSLLYLHYKHGPIDILVLSRATLADAIIICLIIWLLYIFSLLPKHSYLIVYIGIAISVMIEWWALGSGRWAYSNMMPMIPIINVGLTPVVQLGVLGRMVYRIVFKPVFPGDRRILKVIGEKVIKRKNFKV